MRRHCACRFWLPLLLVFTAPLVAQAAPSRRALLIGNANYRSLRPVPAARNDAARLAPLLKDLKFEVQTVEDADLKSLAEVIEEKFLRSVQPGDICLVYFSGYGIQVGSENYLLPVEFDPKRSDDILESAYLAARIPQLLDQAKAGLKILLLDATRSEPALSQRAGVSGQGLAMMEEFRETVLIFSAAAGEVSTEPVESESSPLARALADALKAPSLTLGDLILQARRGVDAMTRGTQRPFVSSNYINEVKFREPPPPPPPKPAVEIVKEAPKPAGPQMPEPRYRVAKDREEYAYIPPGAFLMGCVEDKDAQCRPDEKPRHKVIISKGFWMGRNEVRVRSYERFTQDNNQFKMPRAPINVKRWQESLPISVVHWEEAAAYCKWAGGRLPAEAEWEYVVRAGIAGQVYPFGDFSESRDKANFYGKSGNDKYDSQAPVQSFDPNPFGLFDMSGNLWEWCADYYSPTYYGESPAQDPTGPSSGKERVARGGSYSSDARKHLRLSYREGFEPKGGNLVGFRCVLEDTPATRAGFR